MSQPMFSNLSKRDLIKRKNVIIGVLAVSIIVLFLTLGLYMYKLSSGEKMPATIFVTLLPLCFSCWLLSIILNKINVAIKSKP